jgi:predicted SprT family Zn-dependent metalloprotease
MPILYICDRCGNGDAKHYQAPRKNDGYTGGNVFLCALCGRELLGLYEAFMKERDGVD